MFAESQQRYVWIVGIWRELRLRTTRVTVGTLCHRHGSRTTSGNIVLEGAFGAPGQARLRDEKWG